MSVFAHQLEFALAVAALFGASLRWSARLGARGLELALATSAFAGGAIVLWWLALGVVGLGASAAALLVAAVVTWLATLLVDAGRSRARLGFRIGSGVVVWGAVAGALLAFLAWALRCPSLGADAILYHLPESLAWLHGAQPGSVVQSFYGLPVGNYPLVAELLQGWGVVLSRSFVPATLLMFWSFGLLIVGGWTGLRALRVPALPSALAVASIAIGPQAIGVVNYPSTDLPATAWLVTCAALCACAWREARPGLLAPALLAGGLAIGTKTPALPLTVIVLVVAFVALRGRLASVARPLVVAGFAAAVVGLLWYARNLVQHGSPFWPLVSTPWGDPVPPVITRFDASLLDRPGFTLSRHWSEYAAALAGGVVLLAGIIVAPLLARTRAVLAAALVAALSVLLWAQAPLTGRSHDPAFALVALGTTRYLLPGLCAAALVIALAARRRDLGGLLATLALAGAAVWSIVESAKHGLPTTPPIATFAGGAGGGLAVAGAALIVASRLRRLARSGPSDKQSRSFPVAPAAVRIAATLVCAVLAAGALRPATEGFVGRFARVQPSYATGLAAFVANPGYSRTNAEISMAPILFAPLAGDHLQHKIDLMPADISCAEVARRMRTGWVVMVSSVSEFSAGVYFNAARCLAGKQPTFHTARFTAYGGGG